MHERGMVDIHVVPAPLRLNWTIKVEERKVVTVYKQADAEELATFLGRLMSPASVRMHKRDGTIYRESTFDRENDPPESPG